MRVPATDFLSPAAGYYPRGVAASPATRTGDQPPGPGADELAAARALLRGLGGTPAHYSVALSKRFARDVWVKYESFLAVGSFKLRGATWAVECARARGASGVITASTGNHGQGVAYAASLADVPATIVVPGSVDHVKLRRMAEFGAQVHTSGDRLADAEAEAKRWAAETDATYIEDGESADLMAGAASIGAEIFEQVPAVDTIVVPVGGGNLAAALCRSAQVAGSAVKLIGAQSTAAPGVTVSWLRGELVHARCSTLAGGLATERPGRLSLEVLRERLDAMCLVDEDDLWNGVRVAYDALAHNLELAAVAPLAALQRFPDSIGGSTVVLVASGSCIGSDQLAWILSGRDRAEWLQTACD